MSVASKRDRVAALEAMGLEEFGRTTLGKTWLAKGGEELFFGDQEDRGVSGDRVAEAIYQARMEGVASVHVGNVMDAYKYIPNLLAETLERGRREGRASVRGGKSP